MSVIENFPAPPGDDAALAGLRTVADLIGHAARRHGLRPAVVEEHGPVTSYAGLQALVREAAGAFIARGVRRGDRVAIWAPNSLRWIVAALGLQCAGAVLVPVNTRLKGREAADLLRWSGARLLLTVNGFLGIDYSDLIRGEDLPALDDIILLAGEGGAGGWEAFLAAGADMPAAAIDARVAELDSGDLLDILYTSGTTGRAKGVMTTHAQNLETYRIYSAALGLRPGDRYLIANPFFHAFGYKAGWLSSLIRGVTIYPHAVFDPLAILERIQADRITVLPGPPTLYQTILAQPDLDRFDLSSLRVAITGAASVPVELIRRMRSELAFDTVLTAYGLTETCGTVSMCSADDDAQTVAGTSGKPLAGVEVKIADEDGREVPRGAPGEAMVRGFNVMKGYFEDPDETRRAIDADGWLHTGDIAVMDDRGYIQITDRKKDMFIVGGFNCYPAEIENVLASHPAIAQAAVIGVPDERMGEVAKAYVVLRPGASLTAAELIGWCRRTMANYKVPRTIEIRANLPINAAGKVEKFALRAGG